MQLNFVFIVMALDFWIIVICTHPIFLRRRHWIPNWMITISYFSCWLQLLLNNWCSKINRKFTIFNIVSSHKRLKSTHIRTDGLNFKSELWMTCVPQNEMRDRFGESTNMSYLNRSGVLGVSPEPDTQLWSSHARLQFFLKIKISIVTIDLHRGVYIWSFAFPFWWVEWSNL